MFHLNESQESETDGYSESRSPWLAQHTDSNRTTAFNFHAIRSRDEHAAVCPAVPEAHASVESSRLLLKPAYKSSDPSKPLMWGGGEHDLKQLVRGLQDYEDDFMLGERLRSICESLVLSEFEERTITDQD